MKYREEYGSIFDKDIIKNYFLVQCVSNCFTMGKGIAVEFDSRFKLKNILKQSYGRVGDAVYVNRVFNLITKPRYNDKPTYKSLTATLLDLERQCCQMGIRKLAMPCIASGLDNLDWNKVSKLIKEIFKDRNIEILVRLGDDPNCVKSIPQDTLIVDSIDSILL